MRHIHIEDGLRLRFPGRDEEFDQGVEIGLLVAQLASGTAEFTRLVAMANVEQARDVARQLGYHVRISGVDAGSSEISFSRRKRRPTLTLVHSDVRFA
ncbi:hypothetical protein [uncultured Methylobacterium sp.]|uniref:hypothetical protein n=1 Tax=uncultured Methylobacterium sp. TaxID=157278 RepID=UPI0035C9AF5D